MLRPVHALKLGQRTHRSCKIPRMTQAAFTLNEDGTAQDPAAFQAALKSDQAKLDILRKEPETLAVMLGNNIPALQSMLRSAFQVEPSVARGSRCVCTTLVSNSFLQAEQARRKRQQKKLSERTVDAQRVDATVPRSVPLHVFWNMYHSAADWFATCCTVHHCG